MATTERLVAALKEIAKRHDGVLVPNDVVEAARNSDHPLHDEFEWDDGKAAEAHRVDQARSLIKRVKLEVTVRQVTIEVPRYVRDTERDREQGYVPTVRLRTESERAASTMAEEFKRLRGLAERVRGLAAVAELPDHLRVANAVMTALQSLDAVNLDKREATEAAA